VNILLKQFKSNTQPIPTTFTFHDMCNGFMKWCESTTTSPSGKHLGLYRSLIRIMYLQSNDKNDLQLIKTATECLTIQHLLMTMAINHCHTYPRWKLVHNFLLEKTPGFPLITKLRVIHIYEADWELIQIFFVSHKINKMACKSLNVPIDQAGSFPGRSAIEMGTSKVIMYEVIRNQRLTQKRVTTVLPRI
jgi:hypothetical protein